MTSTVAMLRHHSDARALRDTLAAAGIASVIRSIMNGPHIVFVARKHGRKAEAIARANEGRWGR
jgi:hypothetical protein